MVKSSSIIKPYKEVIFEIEFRGQFNPDSFSLLWLQKNNILGSKESEEINEKLVIKGQARAFSTPFIDVKITRDIFEIGIIDLQNFDLQLDLYLKENSLCSGNVDFVLLTHFHQDHYTGISEILVSCPTAKFFVTKALWNKNFDILVNMLLQINGKANPYHEFKKIADTLRFTNRKILAIGINSKPIVENDKYIIRVHSPNNPTLLHFDKLYLAQILELRTNPAKEDINLQSVVLEVKTKEDSHLYSSDLEYSNKPGLGMKDIMNKFIVEDLKFKIFKIPHHGSANGYDNDWANILDEKAVLKITPYNSSSLPKPKMIASICEHSDEVYITHFNDVKYRKHKGKLKKRIQSLDINMKRFNLQLKGEISTECNKIKTITTLGGTAKSLKIAT